MDTVTLNISLPKKMADQVDLEVAGGSYISRSEFFRTLLRLYSALIKGQTSIEFLEFQKRPLKEIEQGFMSTGKYSKKFVKSIVTGLKRSSVYAN